MYLWSAGRGYPRVANPVVYVSPLLAHGSAGIEGRMYLFFRWATKIVPRLPLWLLRLLSSVIAPLAWLFGASARRQATINARHVLGVEIARTAAGRRKLRRVVRGMFRNSVSNYLDALKLPSMNVQEILRYFSIAHEEYLTEALALGKGAVLFSAHFGPFEYLARWFSAHG